jgi:asparagine synthase (glutamine-hydrolysing)
MSAICGIINLDQKPVDGHIFKRMMTSLNHRGKDGSGIWKNDYIALGHQMFHCNPESLFESLPLVNTTGNLILTADARIDNREELIKLLSVPVSEKKNIPDSALILKSYEKWDVRCPEYLQGDFVFAIWDTFQKKMFCARDHLGFRPLYYYFSGNQFIFSSEIKQVIIASNIRTELNQAALIESMLMRHMDNQTTFFTNINQIPPTHSISISRKGHPRAKPRIKLSGDDEYAELLRELIIQAVHSRMRSAFPVAAHLSGGLDSSAVTVIAARKLKEDGKSLIAVSSVLPLDHSGPESDDRKYIDLIVKQEENIQIRYVTSQNLCPFENLEKVCNYYYAPVDDPLYYVDHSMHAAASQSGARIILDGNSGDMAASYHGEKALHQLFREFKWATTLDLIQKKSRIENRAILSLLWGEIFRNYFPDSWIDFYRHLRKRPKSYLKDYRIFNENILNTELFRDRCQHSNHLYQQASTPHDNILRGITYKSDLANILAYSASTGGWYSTMSLSPLFDKKIIEFMVRIPPEQYILKGWKRSLYRRSMKNILPEEIRWRKTKHPFTPDCHSKMFQSKEKISWILNSKETAPMEEHFIKKSAIMDELNKIKSCTGWEDWDVNTQRIVFKGVMLLSFIRWQNHNI